MNINSILFNFSSIEGQNPYLKSSAKQDNQQALQGIQSVNQGQHFSADDQIQLMGEIELTNKKLESINKGLKFNLHEDSNNFFVQVIDKDQDKVLKELPPHELLDMVSKLWELSGILLDKKV